MTEMDHDGEPVDPVTVAAKIKARGVRPVDLGFLLEAMLRCPTAENVEHYAAKVREASLLRRVRIGLSELAERAKAPDASAGELLSMVAAMLTKVSADEPEQALPVGTLVRDRVGEIGRIFEERKSGATVLTGYPTGVAGLDEKLGGVQPGIVTIVAARPGMGKSSLGLSMADAASDAGYGVHVFSLEDTRDAYADRCLARQSRVAAGKIRACDLNRGEMTEVTNAIGKLQARRGWLVDDRSGISADEIVRSVRRKARDNRTKVVIVDYVQLVGGALPRASAHEHLTAVVTTFANAAKQDRMSWVVMSQLNRSLESRNDKRPMLSDLRESGSLEERAKCVIGLYRGAYYGPLEAAKEDIDYDRERRPFSQEEYEAIAHLLVMKASNGPTGSVWANWDGPLTRLS
jgi:replicative DNA helicase